MNDSKIRVTDIVNGVVSHRELSGDIVGLAANGKHVFSGKTLFELKATYGLPIDFALELVKDANCVVDWVGFIDAARSNKWWDFQTLVVIGQVISDAGYTSDEQKAIIDRFKIYVTQNQHPELK